jgi:hypothetical protein
MGFLEKTQQSSLARQLRCRSARENRATDIYEIYRHLADWGNHVVGASV